MKLKELKKGNRGITLIALIVTIIVLLILTSITMLSVNNKNNITKKARKTESLAKFAELESAALTAYDIASSKKSMEKPSIEDVTDELEKYGYEILQEKMSIDQIIGVQIDDIPIVVNVGETTIVKLKIITNENAKKYVKIDKNDTKAYEISIKDDMVSLSKDSININNIETTHTGISDEIANNILVETSDENISTATVSGDEVTIHAGEMVGNTRLYVTINEVRYDVGRISVIKDD